MLYLEEMILLQQEQNLKSLSTLDESSLEKVPSEWSPLASTKGKESKDVFISNESSWESSVKVDWKEEH